MGVLVGGKQGTTTQPIVYGGVQVSTSLKDTPIPVFWGQCRMATNLMWYNDFEKHPVSPKGKGIGGKDGQYDYTAAVLLGLGRGVIDDIVNVWASGSASTLTTLAALNMTFYDGSASQSPPSFISTNYPAQARNYNNTAYLFCPKLDLGESATVPDYAYECVRANGFYTVTTNGYVSTTGAITPAIDVLMPDVLVDYLTNPVYGLGFSSGDIGDYSSYKTYNRAQGLFFSPCLKSQEQITTTFDRWAQQSNAWIYWNGTQIAFVPLGDSTITGNGVTFTPDLGIAYNLTIDGFLDKDAPVKPTIVDPSDVMNRTAVTITDRTLGYVSNPLEWKDDSLVDLYGLRDNSSVQGDEIKNPTVGNIVVQLIGKRNTYIQRTYTFKTSYRFILCLPGTLITLTEPNIGLNQFPVRVREITEDDDGSLEFTCEEFPGTIGTYTSSSDLATPQTPTIPNQMEDPGSVNTPAVIEPDSAYTNGNAVLVISASGSSPWWGGADVYVAFDSTSVPNKVGTISAPAIQGLLTANLPSHADPDTTNTLAVDCTESNSEPQAVTTADADALRTLSLVCAPPTLVAGIEVLDAGGELLSFGDVTTTGTYTANLTYLRRGQYGTSPGAHSAGALFSVVDVLSATGSSIQYQLPPQYIGAPIYIKLVSFNIFNTVYEDLSSVTEYQYTPTGRGYGGGSAGVPSAPQSVSGVGGIQQVALSWAGNAVTDNVLVYEIYGAAGSSVPFGSTTLLASTAGTSYTIPNLTPNQAYSFYVVAVNVVGSSNPSSPVCNVTTSNVSQTTFGANYSCATIQTKPLSTVIGRAMALINWKLPSVANGGYVEGEVDTAPTATTTFNLLHNGSVVAQVQFAASSKTPTLINASDVSLVIGDFLDLETPASLNGMSGVFGLGVAGVKV